MRNTSNNNNKNNNKKEREREKKYRLRCNNNRKSSALSALFRVRALGVVVSRRRRRPIGFRVTPFPNPNYLGSQNVCLFPEDFPLLFLHKKRAQKSRHVLSSPPTRERVFPRVFRFLVFVAIVAVAHHHHQSFLGVFSRRRVDTIR